MFLKIEKMNMSHWIIWEKSEIKAHFLIGIKPCVELYFAVVALNLKR